MRQCIVFLAGLIMAVAIAFGAHAATADAKRVALVIGNSKYRHAIALPNPANDANLITATLRDAGFQVIEGTDLDKAGMVDAIDRFTEAAYDAEVALVYYSGHGMQVEGNNFLIPVDAELTAPAHLKTRTIQVEQILAALPPDPAIGVIILDACRDNPLSRSLAAALPATRSTSVGTGLAPVQATTTGTGTGGTLIAYSTDPGAVALDGKGQNSPYTTALAKHLATPGVELQSALTRVRGDVTEATLGKQRPWHNASLGREVYLGGKPPVAATAPQIVIGEESIKAPDAASSAASSWEVEQRLWDEASKRDTAPYYEAYLEQFPAGRFATVARLNIDMIEEKQASPQVAIASAAAPVDANGSTFRTGVVVPDEVKTLPGTQITEAALGLDRAARTDLQLRLAALGFDLGGADGSLGNRSRKAIGEWQTQRGIVSTTFLTREQYTFLKVETEPMMAAIRAQHDASLAAAAAERAKQNQRQVKKKQTETQKQAVQQQTTGKKKRRQVAAADDGPDENLGRVERGGGSGDDTLGKVLLFGTGVAVGGLLGK